MRLENIIAELDKKTEEYRAAADALRNLLKYEGARGEGAQSTGNTVSSSPATTGNSIPAKPAARQNQKISGKGSDGKGNGSGKRTMSPEARAKISAAAKARHAAKKQGGA